MWKSIYPGRLVDCGVVCSAMEPRALIEEILVDGGRAMCSVQGKEPSTASQSSCEVVMFKWFWCYIWPVQALVFLEDGAAAVGSFPCLKMLRTIMNTLSNTDVMHGKVFTAIALEHTVIPRGLSW